jgi:hypothetical protein
MEERMSRIDKLKALKERGVDITDSPPADLRFIPEGTYNHYSKDKGLKLITPQQLTQLPDGTRMWSVLRHEVIVGVDRIDPDTRGGFLAVGFRFDKPPSGATRAQVLQTIKDVGGILWSGFPKVPDE